MRGHAHSSHPPPPRARLRLLDLRLRPSRQARRFAGGRHRGRASVTSSPSRGRCSDDGFVDFRYGLIALGRRRFEQALADPDSLCAVDDIISNEAFGYAARNAYRRRTRQEMPPGATTQAADPAGESWDFDDEAENRRRLPRLSERYL